MSNIRNLFTYLADLPVTFKDEAGSMVTPTGYDLPELKKHWERPDMPCRLILPMEEYNAVSAGVFEPMNAGTSTGGEMGWNVVDLMLYQKTGQTRGLQDVLPDLVSYMGAYVHAILGNNQPVPGFRMQSVAPNAGVYEFPVGSGQTYYGVEAQVSYIELLQ